jgi:drug/metabolite transporter (DMT)-like permease
MVYLILACVLYSIAVLIGATASRNANTNLVAAVSNLASFIIPFLFVLPSLSKEKFADHKYGIWMSVLGGLVVGLFVLTLTKAFTQNKVGIVAPVVYGGTIFLTTILSYFIFHEKIAPLEGIGLFFVLVGLAFVAYGRAVA